MSKITKIILAVIVVLLLGFGVYTISERNDDETPTETTTSEEVQEETGETPERTIVYEAFGNLLDVSESGSSGVATAEFYSDGVYELIAEFADLAPTTNGDFYEGWLVNRETSDFFSTGVIETDPSGTEVNTYTSEVDHQDAGYNFYVLTLEPDDGDPAPAEHIVEGVLEIAE